MLVLCWDLLMHSNGAWAQVRSLHDHNQHLWEEACTKVVRNAVAHGHAEACTEQRAPSEQPYHQIKHQLPQFKSWKLAAVTHSTLQASTHLWKGSEVSNVCWSVTCSRVTRDLTRDAINRNLQLSTAGNQTNGGPTSVASMVTGVRRLNDYSNSTPIYQYNSWSKNNYFQKFNNHKTFSPSRWRTACWKKNKTVSS